VLFATIGVIVALLLRGGIWLLVVGAFLLGPCLATFNSGLNRNPHSRGSGGGYWGGGSRR
jgi:hypothetical protein